MSARFDINALKIASPCPARWEDMSGDDRARFCGQCQKHVYNFSTMTSKEVETLIREKEGNLCGRIYRRKDGTVMTSDCPSGKVIARRKRFQWLAGAVAGLALLATALWARAKGAEEVEEESRITTELNRQWYDLKVKLGWETPMLVAGEISLPPQPTPPVNGNTPPPTPIASNPGGVSSQSPAP